LKTIDFIEIRLKFENFLETAIGTYYTRAERIYFRELEVIE
jgi:hypothetical protein